VAEANPKYTVVAAKAFSLAEIFAASFERGLDGPVHFKVELSAPEGPSTAGGKQALQHIKLVPDGGGPATVIGSADTTRGVAEIRTFDHVAALYAQRFRGTQIPVEPARFNELAQALTNFFKSMNMKVSFAELAEGPLAGRQSQAPAVASTEGTASRWLLLVLGAVVGLAVVVAAYVFIFLR